MKILSVTLRYVIKNISFSLKSSKNSYKLIQTFMLFPLKTWMNCKHIKHNYGWFFLEISKIYTQSYNQSLMKRKFGVNVYGFIPTMPRLIINKNNESTNRNAFYFKTLKLI